MSTDSLDRAFGIAGDHVPHTGWEDGVLVLRLEQTRQTLRSAACEAREVQCKGGTVVRTLKTLLVRDRSVQLRLEVPRVRCHSCGLERQVPLALAELKKAYTKCFSRATCSN